MLIRLYSRLSEAFLYVVLMGLVQHCAQEAKTSGGSSSGASTPSPAGNIAGNPTTGANQLTTRILWQNPVVQSSYSANGTSITAFGLSSATDDVPMHSAYCFENTYSPGTNSCKRANSTLLSSTAGSSIDPLTNALSYLPLVIQGLTMNFSTQTVFGTSTSASTDSRAYSQIVIDAASFTTSHLGFDTQSGVLVLTNSVTKNLVGTCVPGVNGAVGYTPDPVNNPTVITGVRVYENNYNLSTLSGQSSADASVKAAFAENQGNTTVYSSAMLAAGQVNYSLLVPQPATNSTTQRFLWNFYNSAPATDNFGIYLVNSTAFASGGNLTSGTNYKFGWSSTDANLPTDWTYHVLTGFCIQGHKTFINTSNQTITRPLIPAISVVLYTPKLAP